MSDRRRWALATGVTGVMVAAVRWWTSRGRDEYAIWPDEPAQLAIARFIGGGTRWNMDDHSVWRPLFGTLLAPTHWFTDDPVAVLHVAFGLNAVLGGVAAALLVFLARRLTPLDPWWAAGAATVVSLAPATIFTTEFVFAESLVAPLFLATLLALLRLHGAPTLTGGVIAAGLAAAAFGAHSRMLPLGLLVVAVVVLAAVRQRISSRDASVVVAAAMAAILAVEGYTRWIVGRLWDEPSTRNSPAGVIEQLGSGPAVLVSLIGQSWYLVVASVGVVVYGLAVLVGRSRDREQFGGDARIVLAAVGACFALSVVFMADRWRSDQLVYGRYNDAVVTPVLLLGVAVVLGALPMRRLLVLAVATAGGTVAGGVVLWALRRDTLADSNGLEPMILGLQPFATSPTAIDVVRISVWAAAVTIALALVAQWPGAARRLAVSASLAALVALGWVRTSSIVDRSWDDSGDISAVQKLGDGILGGVATVDFYLPEGNTGTNRMMLYQFYLPHTEFSVVHGPDDATSTLVFAHLDAEGFAEPPARLVWTDPKGRYGLFRR
jgi:hypothetical protein